MKKQKIVIKLFVVTSILLLILLVAQFIFQTFYFEEFYTLVKEQSLIKDMEALSSKIVNGSEDKSNQELLKYGREKGVAVGVVNIYGRPLYGFGREAEYPFVEVTDKYESVFRVYLNRFVESKEFLEHLKGAKEIKVSGQITKSEYYEIYPISIQIDDRVYTINNGSFPPHMGKLLTDKLGILGVVEVVGDIVDIYASSSEYGIEYRESRLLSEVSKLIETDSSIYNLFESKSHYIYESLDTFTGINNMIGILPMEIQETPTLLVTMVSLQPVEEAVEVMERYFVIIFTIIFIVSLACVYIYAKQITKPLLQLNEVTKKLSNLDFSDTPIISRDDEIGNLADNIYEMSNKLQRTLDRLKEDLALRNKLDEERKRFIADVSHELKTPLTILKGTCEGLVDGVYDKSREEYYKMMLEEVNEMGQMVQDLLQLSRIENEEILKLEPFDLSEIIYKVHSHLKPLVREKNLKVRFEMDEVFVYADEKKIETVIRNIYNNAIFYTPVGQKVDIKVLECEDKVKMSIENYGVYIEEHQLDKIWDAFYRIDQSRNKELGGSGLGLYIVKQILEKHDCSFGIHNTEKGVQVWIELVKCREQ